MVTSGINPDEERLTEEEWATRFNTQISETILVRSQEVHDRPLIQDVFTTNGSSNPCIVLDSGATSSVVGVDWVKKCLGSKVSTTCPASKKIRLEMRGRYPVKGR